MLKKVINFFKKQNSFRYILLGFVIFILLGSGLLMLPASRTGYKADFSYLDAIFTSASAVTTTGQVTLDPGQSFTPFGQAIIAILMQGGGLGITTFGAGLITAIRRGTSLRERSIIQESFNVEDGKDLMSLFKNVFIYTIIIEFSCASLSLISFSRYYSLGHATWISVFHSISAFNNAGFDIFKGYPFINLPPIGIEGAEAYSMQLFHSDYLLIAVTAIAAVLGGLGFLVLSDITKKVKRNRRHHLTLQSKVVLLTTFLVLALGTLVISLVEINASGFTPLDAFFLTAMSTTSGFSTFNVNGLKDASKAFMIITMFIGGSPGSTAGGIKTTTLFVIILGIICVARQKKAHVFHYSISKDTIHKAMVVTILSFMVVVTAAFLICVFDYKSYSLPDNNYDFMDVLFETLGSFSTAGLSTGLVQEPFLSIGAKIILMASMVIGRIGPLTVASVWRNNKKQNFDYAEGILPVG